MSESKRAEPCRSCLQSVHLTEDEMKQVFGDATNVRHVKLVEADTYNARMRICEDCDCLQYGTTCVHCGCIVQFKAKFISSKCPFPYAPKW